MELVKLNSNLYQIGNQVFSLKELFKFFKWSEIFEAIKELENNNHNVAYFDDDKKFLTTDLKTI